MSPIILIVLVAAYHHGATGQSLCTTPTGATGTCKSILQCEPLLALVTNDQRTEKDMFILRKSLCGYENNKPKVCCPKPCQTPDGGTGECINIYKCDELANRLRWPVTKQNMDIVVNYSCENEDNFGVCCPLPVEDNCEQRINALPMDPRSLCCGVENVVSNKIVGGNATTLDQYPWLALIEYVKNGKLKTLCGSALISGKYVLTAKHCVTGDVLELGTPTNIRLGEYDTSSDGQDCIAVDGGGMDCNNGFVRIPIETIIPYPGNGIRNNDIALIRMTQMAPYTDFIRPICLPNVDYTSLPPAKFDMFVAGWGAVSTSISNSKVKMHVRVPYVPLEVCQETYCKRKTSLSEKQLCAGGENGKDSCKGDSGGPLMYNSGRTFEAIGIVSFGPLPCGSENVPGVYTNVFQYKDWIISKIKP